MHFLEGVSEKNIFQEEITQGLSAIFAHWPKHSRKLQTEEFSGQKELNILNTSGKFIGRSSWSVPGHELPQNFSE